LLVLRLFCVFSFDSCQVLSINVINSQERLVSKMAHYLPHGTSK